MLDEQSGTLKSGDLKPYKQSNTGSYSGSMPEVREVNRLGDSGGASRFFYCAKSSKSERNAGLEGMPDRILARSNGAKSGNNDDNPNYNDEAKSGYDKRIETKNHHPTVKPIKLMRYLCRLITPPNGTVLDPFAGSGSTLLAAKLEGFKAIGIEREAEYVEIAKRRIANE
jgi:site-specific DNA-methyltransferase (adenine-specific)